MMNTEKKMTYVAALSYVLENCELPTEVAEKLETLKGQQEKRNAGVKKPTARQTENVELVGELVDVLTECGKPVTVTEVMEASAKFGAMSNQRVSALLKKLVDSGLVVKTTEKRKSYFAMAEEVEVEG